MPSGAVSTRLRLSMGGFAVQKEEGAGRLSCGAVSHKYKHRVLTVFHADIRVVDSVSPVASPIPTARLKRWV